MELEYGRPLPLELQEEIHKCLPLPNAIHVLANISSRAFVDINKSRMLRNVQRIKTSLKEYINTLVHEKEYDLNSDEEEDKEEKNGHKKLMIYNKKFEWKPQLNALLRYGGWMTSTRELRMANIAGVPKNFVEELILQLANSRSPKMMLQNVEMGFGKADEELPIPTFLLEQLLNKKEQYQNGRMLFGPVDLETEDGQILQIFEGELKLNQYPRYLLLRNYTLRLFVMNKVNRKNLFEIIMRLDQSKKFIYRLEFSKWNIQSLDENGKFEQNGNKLKAKDDIYWSHKLDIFLRRGAAFSQFRHFKIKEPNFLRDHPDDYADFLINYISNRNHPEDFLESIDINLNYSSSPYIKKFWQYCQKGIEEGGNVIKIANKKLQILSAKTTKLDNKLEFTLANGPTNGAYLFDVEMHFENGRQQIRGIKIQKRKFDEMKCDDPIGLGKKRKATNYEDEDGPICSGKIMKKYWMTDEYKNLTHSADFN